MKAAQRHHLPNVFFGQGMVASDGAPFFQPIPPSNLIVWAMPVLNPPPPWLMTERPQLVKGKGWVSAARSGG